MFSPAIVIMYDETDVLIMRRVEIRPTWSKDTLVSGFCTRRKARADLKIQQRLRPDRQTNVPRPK